MQPFYGVGDISYSHDVAAVEAGQTSRGILLKKFRG
jgi:hypothetical protein